MKSKKAVKALGNGRVLRKVKGRVEAYTPAQFASLRRTMKIREHRRAIIAAKAALPLMGAEWVDGVVRYRTHCLAKLGVLP